MKSWFSRNNLKISRVSSNAWRGTVAAQTNEQLRERTLFEKPVHQWRISAHDCRTKNHSLPKPSQSTPNSTVPNLGMTGPTNTNTAKIRRNHPKQKPSETLKPWFLLTARVEVRQLWQPLELFQVLTGWGPGATWSSSSQKDQLLRGIQGIARLGLRRLSWTFQGCKDLQSLFTRVVCYTPGIKARGMNNSKQNTTMHKTITPLEATTGHIKIGNSLAPWSVTSITSICNFPAMLGKAQ